MTPEQMQTLLEDYPNTILTLGTDEEGMKVQKATLYGIELEVNDELDDQLNAIEETYTSLEDYLFMGPWNNVEKNIVVKRCFEVSTMKHKKDFFLEKFMDNSEDLLDLMAIVYLP